MKNLKSVRTGILPYFISIGLVCIITLLGEFVKRSLEPTNLVMPYLLIVLISALLWGKGPAIAASILSVLFFDFFLVPPYLTLNVSQIQYVFTFAGLLIVGLVVSTLASQARKQTMMAVEREAHTAALLRLSEQSRQLELMQQTEKLQSALLNSISHDLKTPLVSIMGSLTALLDNDSNFDDASRRELLETAREETNRLNQIVTNLLDMTKMEAGALHISRTQCQLKDVLGVSLEQLKGKIGSRTIKITMPEDLPELPMDFSFMVKVLINMIDNAIKFSDPGTPIEITSSIVGDTVTIEVKDKGYGIPGEDLKRIFEKFYRAEKPRMIAGTGLGLSICKGIIEAHGGTIVAENNTDKGAIFRILLPLV